MTTPCPAPLLLCARDLPQIWWSGRRYVLLRTPGPALAAAPGRILSRWEAEHVLSELERTDAYTLRALYLQLSDALSVAQLSNQSVLRWLNDHLHGGPGGARFTLIQLAEDQPAAHATPAPRPDPWIQSLDRALAALGERDLIQRGFGYRLLRPEAAAQLSSRDQYEALSDRELSAVLHELAADTARAQPQHAALNELLALHVDSSLARGTARFDVPPSARGPALVLLRRRRAHVHSAAAAAAVTPSQLRAARESHFIEVSVLDPEQNPLAGVRLELVLPGGAVETLSTDREGFARVARIQPGSATIRVLDLDGETWRPLSGAAARPSGKQRGAQAHLVRRGESLSKIAARYGIRNWRKIWQAPQNEALRRRRRSPHVLLPGDRVVVPKTEIWEIERETDATHRIEVARGVMKTRLRLQDLAGQPLPNLGYDYRYLFDGSWIERPGTNPTDAEGWLEETLPLSVDTLYVTLRKPKLRFTHHVSALEPAQDEDTSTPIAPGVKRRLVGLGYATGARGDAAPSLWPGALALFQANHLQRKEAHGEPDSETLTALQRTYSA